MSDNTLRIKDSRDQQPKMKPMKNIILIGMPGAGKSTLGVILAKTLRMNFIDTDILIQERTGELLQDIIDNEGSTALLKIEEETILDLAAHHAVIATGGSAVFSEKAMKHMRSDGVVLYLDISFEKMVQRLKNIKTRGIVLFEGSNLHDMYSERVPLYEKYADITIGCSEGDFEDIVGKVIRELQ